MPTLIFILLVSYTTAFAANSHEAPAPKNQIEKTESQPKREPASVKEEISNEDAEKLITALEQVDQELRQIHNGH